MQILLLGACSGLKLPISETFADTLTPRMVFPDITCTITQTIPLTTSTSSPQATVSVEPRLPPDRWQEWPVIPATVSQRTKEIFRRGLDLGNNPYAFSKIGDGGAATVWFLADFDLGGEYYNLGAYSSLQKVITYFKGSFGRTSVAAGRGFNTTILLDPAFADNTICGATESPLDCEIRQQQPSFAFFSLGTNQAWYPDLFASELRIIIERLLERGVIPILSTKADNREGNQRINQSIASLAYEYDLPLWNFWKAVQPLPNHGLQADLEHLTWAGPFFDDPARMENAWPWRNLTALQVLDLINRSVSEQP
jgi:hypothetical protein